MDSYYDAMRDMELQAMYDKVASGRVMPDKARNQLTNSFGDVGDGFTKSVNKSPFSKWLSQTNQPFYDERNVANFHIKQNQANQHPPVKAQNKAAKNAYFDSRGRNNIDEFAAERNPYKSSDELYRNEGRWMGTEQPNATNVRKGYRYVDSMNEFNVKPRVLGPGSGRLPALGGFIGAGGAVSGVLGAADLLKEVYKTKDPIAAYRNWVGGNANSYE